MRLTFAYKLSDSIYIEIECFCKSNVVVVLSVATRIVYVISRLEYDNDLTKIPSHEFLRHEKEVFHRVNTTLRNGENSVYPSKLICTFYPIVMIFLPLIFT